MPPKSDCLLIVRPVNNRTKNGRPTDEPFGTALNQTSRRLLRHRHATQAAGRYSNPTQNCAAVCSHIIPFVVLPNRTTYNVSDARADAGISCTCRFAASRTCVDMPGDMSRHKIHAQCAKHAFRGGDAYRIEKHPRMPSYGLSRTRRDNTPRHASESPQKATCGRKMRLPIAR